MQALSDLLQLPGPVASFVQQQLAAPGAETLGATRPGHCLWQLRKLLPPTSAVAPLSGAFDGWTSSLDAYECVTSAAMANSLLDQHARTKDARLNQSISTERRLGLEMHDGIVPEAASGMAVRCQNTDERARFAGRTMCGGRLRPHCFRERRGATRACSGSS